MTSQVESLCSFLTKLKTRYAAPIVSVTLRTRPVLLAYRRGSERAPENRRPFESLVRLSRGAFQLGYIGQTYERRVNNAIARLGEDGADVVTFQAEKLWQGRGRPGPIPFTAEHTVKGELYLVCYPPTNGLPHKSEEQWFMDEEPLEGEELTRVKADWLARTSVYSPKQAAAGLTNVGEQVHPRLPHLENVVQLMINTRAGGVLAWDESGRETWEP